MLLLEAMKPEEVKDLRERLGVTQDKLARMLNTTQTSVARWELKMTGVDPKNVRRMKLLELQHAGKLPPLCQTTKRRKFDFAYLRRHVLDCEQCRANVDMLALEMERDLGLV